MQLSLQVLQKTYSGCTIHWTEIEAVARTALDMTVIMTSFNSILSLLLQMECNQSSSTEVRLEATGLLKAITQPSFPFIACITHSLLDPPNTLLQAHTTSLYTGVSVVQRALKCVEELRCESQFDILYFGRYLPNRERMLNPPQSLHRNDEEK